MNYLRTLPDSKFYGAQGASLVYVQQYDQLKNDYTYVTMDEEDRLWLDLDGGHGGHGVPCVRRYSGCAYCFSLGSFGGDWRVNDLLLSFSDAA